MRALATLAALLLGTADDGFRAGFAEIEITPPVGIPMQGANAALRAHSVNDPLFARAAVFERGTERVGILALDLALVSAADTASIRRRIEKDHGLAADRLMVSATHNHAGPAVIDEGLPRDEKWMEGLVERCSVLFGRALEARREAQTGAGRSLQWEVAFNRRILMQDGTVRTHGSLKDPKALRFEGPIDPEVGVFAARGPDGKILGALVNFACHPGHFCGKGVLSAGFPGVVARVLKEKGVPVTLFLQGAAGNLHHQDPRGFPEKSMEEIGKTLAEDAEKALRSIDWKSPETLSARTKTLTLPFRAVTAEDIAGTTRGAQRFGEKGYYDRKIPELLEVMKQRGHETGEVQVFRVGDALFAAQPSESFAEHGLRLRQETWPLQTFVVCYANGMLGYLPHREGFARGGYEATFGPPSCMAPDTGDRLVDAAVELARGGAGARPAIQMLGGGDSHDYERWFRGTDGETLASVGAVSYTSDVKALAAALPSADVLYLCSNQRIDDPAARRAILDLADRGKGILVVHASTWYNWADWPEYNRTIVGGGSRGHEPHGEFEVRVAAPGHPILRDVPASFKVTDELYQWTPDPSAGIEVLAVATAPRNGREYPVAWTVKHPKARIVCLTLGHDAPAHRHPAFRTLLAQAAAWAAGRTR